MNAKLGTEPQLSADFAARVLALADRTLARRRRVRFIGGVSAAFVGIIVIGAAGWIRLAVAPQGPAPMPVLASATAQTPSNAGGNANDVSDPLTLLFPDAQPVARFAAEDGGAGNDAGAAALFDEQD
jgi:hypothetical protein